MSQFFEKMECSGIGDKSSGYKQKVRKPEFASSKRYIDFARSSDVRLPRMVAEIDMIASLIKILVPSLANYLKRSICTSGFVLTFDVNVLRFEEKLPIWMIDSSVQSCCETFIHKYNSVRKELNSYL